MALEWAVGPCLHLALASKRFALFRDITFLKLSLLHMGKDAEWEKNHTIFR